MTEQLEFKSAKKLPKLAPESEKGTATALRRASQLALRRPIFRAQFITSN